MILQDEMGDKMQAYVRKACIPKHDVWLSENQSLIVRKPSLGANLSTYRYVDSPHKRCFTLETRLCITNEFKGHLYGLSLATFDDIKAKNIPQDGTIDVIGHVSRFFTNKNSFFRESQHQNRRTMEFADLSGNKIYLTLWDDYLKQLTKYVADNPDEEYLIIVLKFARVKYYGENVYVNNSYGNAVSRLLINDYLYEVLDYKKRLLEISSQVHVEIPKPVGSSMLLTVKDEFLKNYQFYSISDLCCILGAKNVIIIGTVKVYECRSASCNYLGVNAGPRFRIPIRVQDTTGVVLLTLFDCDARQLFNKAADYFVTTDVELDPMHTFPEELNIILEKKFAFIVEVSDYNIRNSYDVYGVSKLTDDESVLNELDKQLGHGQDMCTPSSNHFTPISISEDVIPDRLASLDEKVNSLPIVDVKLKCKLDDTYDVHDDTGTSATKTKVDEQQIVDANVGEGDIVGVQKI
ncbi:uncharacterized protein LOC143553910 [Bidens hawaiensis]|uniref:uncharacterized protein LOC143553910 n=1 Tax=Bidens hawaiensis TaxID=980011 RepID=UPI004048F85C